MTRQRWAAGLALACAAGAALAQQGAKPAPVPAAAPVVAVVVPHWYIGGAIGQTILDLPDSAMPAPGATDSSLNKGRNQTGFKAFAGYRIHRNFAVEGAYADYGQFTVTRLVNAPAGGELKANVRIRGLSLDAVGILPFDNGFSFFGKLGGLYARSSASYSTSGAYTLPANTNTYPRSRELAFKYGIGLAYAVTQSASLRLEYEVAKKVGEENTVEGDLKALFAGLQYRF